MLNLWLGTQYQLYRLYHFNHPSIITKYSVFTILSHSIVCSYLDVHAHVGVRQALCGKVG